MIYQSNVPTTTFFFFRVDRQFITKRKRRIKERSQGHYLLSDGLRVSLPPHLQRLDQRPVKYTPHSCCVEQGTRPSPKDAQGQLCFQVWTRMQAKPTPQSAAGVPA
jgi:hypothetical protein